MNNHLELSDSEFEKTFGTCVIELSVFSHEAHLRLAWIHIDKYGIDEAIKNIRTQLKHFVKFYGKFDKYNETVTIAAVKAVYHFKLKSKTDNFIDFIIENPRLKNNFKELLGYHYTTDIFNSKKAKRKFLSPELLPFD